MKESEAKHVAVMTVASMGLFPHSFEEVKAISNWEAVQAPFSSIVNANFKYI